MARGQPTALSSTSVLLPISLNMAEDTYFHADLDEVDSSPTVYAHTARQTVDSVEMHVGMLSGPPRKGKWTFEEENYANKIIKYFNRGMLSIEAGTTLRSYLSDRLHCDPMRITKKYAGASCIGKQVFQPSDEYCSSPSITEKIESELKDLESKFVCRLFSKSGSSASLVEDEHVYIGRHSLAVSSSDPLSAISKVGRPFSRGSRHASAPQLTELLVMHERPSGTPLLKRRRTQSLMDLEHYADDDAAAGVLLMQFMDTMNRSAEKKAKPIHDFGKNDSHLP